MNSSKVTLQFSDMDGRSIDPARPLCLFPFSESVPIPDVGEVIEFSSGPWQVVNRRFHYRRAETGSEVDISFFCERTALSDN